MPEDVRQKPLSNSTAAGNSVTSTGSGSAFVSITPTAGYYRVYVQWYISGTAETAVNNVKFKTKGANVVTGLLSVPSIVYTLVFDQVEADGTNPISLCATSAAVVGSIYTGSIVVQQIG